MIRHVRIETTDELDLTIVPGKGVEVAIKVLIPYPKDMPPEIAMEYAEHPGNQILRYAQAIAGMEAESHEPEFEIQLLDKEL
jgi:hypothetical protein